MGSAKPTRSVIKRLIAAGIFTLMGIYLTNIVPSAEIAWVCAILLLTIYLFTFEIVSIDVADRKSVV